MHKVIIILLMTVCCRMSVFAQTNFYTNVTNLWYQGNKTNVLSIANARLAQNTNDIAGLILKMECDVAFFNLSEISNSILRVIHAADTITTSNFVRKYNIERQELLDDLELFKTYPTPAELSVERAKAGIPNKPLPTYLFEALQNDGYFEIAGE
ncbi:MAG: hypothetical protein PHO37_11360 [Kiritimatiellae bacterium]|nr:hypothetical protein [Kiritimatiellia bacterium]